MALQLDLGDLEIDVVQKDIKNLHLSVHPPSGRVRIAAPQRVTEEAIRLFAISKLSWIRTQQRKLQEQERETEREYLERESHYVWGRRYLLAIEEAEGVPSIKLSHRRMRLTVRPGTDVEKRSQIIEDWYREQVRLTAAGLVQDWEPRLNVTVNRVYLRRMKTRWGSCNHSAGTIRLNTDLGRKPVQCLEYIIVHEMVHLLEPSHNEVFQQHMNQFLPDWKARREALNQLPVRHENWHY
jgi:predicted metal-dependent hydrolase